MTITEEQRNFLEEHGYLLLEGVLDNSQLKAVKERVNAIREHEGPWAGAVSGSKLRERLIQNNRHFARRCYDFMFSVLRVVLLPMIIRLGVWDMLITYQSRPKKRQNGLLYEISEILFTVAEQSEKHMIRICNLVNKGAEFDVCYKHPLVLNAIKEV